MTAVAPHGTDALKLVVAVVGEHRLGFPAAAVAEVLPMVRVTPLPGSPPVVRGVVDIRGRVTAVLDVRARLGLEPRPDAPSDRLVVTTARQRPVALPVDHAEDLVDVPAPDLHPVPHVAPEGLVAGVARLADGLLLVHDVDRFLGADEAVELDAALARHADRGDAGA